MAVTKAIRPSEVAKAKRNSMPAAVIESFNELIVENFCNGSATVTQPDVVKRMIEKGLTSSDIFKNGWLDVEGIFEAGGWEVNYDKPGYNESYEANFTFSAR
jgi:hypothetical protein